MVNILDSALSPLRLRPDSWPEHEDPASHMAWKKKKKKKKKRKRATKRINKPTNENTKN